MQDQGGGTPSRIGSAAIDRVAAALDNHLALKLHKRRRIPGCSSQPDVQGTKFLCCGQIRVSRLCHYVHPEIMPRLWYAQQQSHPSHSNPFEDWDTYPRRAAVRIHNDVHRMPRGHNRPIHQACAGRKPAENDLMCRGKGNPTRPTPNNKCEHLYVSAQCLLQNCSPSIQPSRSIERHTDESRLSAHAVQEPCDRSNTAIFGWGFCTPIFKGVRLPLVWHLGFGGQAQGSRQTAKGARCNLPELAPAAKPGAANRRKGLHPPICKVQPLSLVLLVCASWQS
jgi:hypothetical protein